MGEFVLPSDGSPRPPEKIYGLPAMDKAEVMTKREGVDGEVEVRLPAGCFWVPPTVLAHIRVLEKAIEKKEADLRVALKEIDLR